VSDPQNQAEAMRSYMQNRIASGIERKEEEKRKARRREDKRRAFCADAVARHRKGAEHASRGERRARIESPVPSKPTDSIEREPITDRDARFLRNEAEFYACLEWLRRAQQVEFLRHLEGRSDEDKERIHAMIRSAKSDVLAKWGDPRDHSGNGTMRALYDSKGPYSSVTAWSDLDALMFDRIARMVRQRDTK